MSGKWRLSKITELELTRLNFCEWNENPLKFLEFLGALNSVRNLTIKFNTASAQSDFVKFNASECLTKLVSLRTLDISSRSSGGMGYLSHITHLSKVIKTGHHWNFI